MLNLGIRNNYSEEFTDLVVTRYQWGSCEDPIIVTSDPVTMPPLGGGLVISFSVPAPLANVFYLFEAKLMDSAGNLVEIADEYNMGLTQSPRDLASDGSAVAMRGPMGLEGLAPYISPCPDGCWGDPGNRFYLGEQAPPVSDLWAFAYAGVTVDITGYIVEDDGMSGPLYDIFVESYEVLPPGSCEDPVATEIHSWGHIKATYW
jgi:hypothetical protein